MQCNGTCGLPGVTSEQQARVACTSADDVAAASGGGTGADVGLGIGLSLMMLSVLILGARMYVRRNRRARRRPEAAGTADAQHGALGTADAQQSALGMAVRPRGGWGSQGLPSPPEEPKSESYGSPNEHVADASSPGGWDASLYKVQPADARRKSTSEGSGKVVRALSSTEWDTSMYSVEKGAAHGGEWDGVGYALRANGIHGGYSMSADSYTTTQEAPYAADFFPVLGRTALARNPVYGTGSAPGTSDAALYVTPGASGCTLSQGNLPSRPDVGLYQVPHAPEARRPPQPQDLYQHISAQGADAAQPRSLSSPLSADATAAFGTVPLYAAAPQRGSNVERVAVPSDTVPVSSDIDKETFV